MSKDFGFFLKTIRIINKTQIPRNDKSNRKYYFIVMNIRDITETAALIQATHRRWRQWAGFAASTCCTEHSLWCSPKTLASTQTRCHLTCFWRRHHQTARPCWAAGTCCCWSCTPATSWADPRGQCGLECWRQKNSRLFPIHVWNRTCQQNLCYIDIVLCVMWNARQDMTSLTSNSREGGKCLSFPFPYRTPMGWVRVNWTPHSHDLSWVSAFQIGARLGVSRTESIV